jgi:enamine deaminase RidA (YjgF/YER057c/UK114 family)
MAAERRIINPWSWQDEFGFVQANEVRNIQRMLICSGQAAIDAEGRPLHRGDMRAQFIEAMDNLETVLREAGFTLSDVMRLNYYTTDVDQFFGVYGVLTSRLAEAPVVDRPACWWAWRAWLTPRCSSRSKPRQWRSSGVTAEPEGIRRGRAFTARPLY